QRRGISINRAESYMIGDSETDILAGEKAGLRPLRIDGNSFAGLIDAARSIVGHSIQTRIAQ
ncbi:MAG: HAD hydrolase-like protein, partial [Syntrophorhabdaceae bacterium]